MNELAKAKRKRQEDTGAIFNCKILFIPYFRDNLLCLA